MSRTRIVKGKITEITGGTHRIYGNRIIINAGGRIDYFAKNYTYGDPEDPPKRIHPDIVSVQFLDENNSVLKKENIAVFGNIQATNILYGKKIKIKIVTKEVADGTKIEFAVKGNSKNETQKFLKIDALKWNLEIQNNTCETDLFSLNMLWYNEDYECYDYNLHKTNIKAEDLNIFTIKGILCLIPFKLLNDEDELKPIAYLRNYEELIGLFKTNNSGEKTLIDNYENKFINYNREIFKISSEFSDYLSDTENLTLTDIKARVKADAKKLWDAAVKQVQAGNLDDRPLYWARNKMQVSLKRNSLFEKDINFETSIVNKDSELEKIIQLFEEQSRNYTNIDFSKAAGKKKLLITGFDPFILNDDPKMPEKIRSGNPLQSNPSGINALALHGRTIGNYSIQTLICPVRYKDFDEFKEGKGIIENFIQPFIQEVDMIITVSQGDVFRFDIDRFPCKNRGGFMDNMLWGNQEAEYNSEKFKQLTNGKEFYETTLAYTRMIPTQNNPSETFCTYFNQTFIAKEKSNTNNKKEEVELIEYQDDYYDKSKCIITGIEEIQNYTSISGSGGDYLSNEIFYRVSKMRNELKPNLASGHLHVPLTQANQKIKDTYIRYRYRNADKLTKDINPAIENLISNIKSIIIKI